MNRRKQVIVNLPTHEYVVLKAIADKSRASMSDTIRFLLDKGLEDCTKNIPNDEGVATVKDTQDDKE